MGALQYLVWKWCPKMFCQQPTFYPVSPVKFSRVETGYAEASLVQKSSSTEKDTPLQAAPPSEVLGGQPPVGLAEPRAALSPWLLQL